MTGMHRLRLENEVFIERKILLFAGVEDFKHRLLEGKRLTDTFT